MFTKKSWFAVFSDTVTSTSSLAVAANEKIAADFDVQSTKFTWKGKF